MDNIFTIIVFLTGEILRSEDFSNAEIAWCTLNVFIINVIEKDLNKMRVFAHKWKLRRSPLLCECSYVHLIHDLDN